MRSLVERTKQVHTAMTEKAKGVLQQRDDMRTQVEEASAAKEAVSAEANLPTCLSLLLENHPLCCKGYLAYVWSGGKCFQALLRFGS